MRKKVTDGLAALALMIFIITAAVVLTLNFKPLFYMDIDALDIPSLSGMEKRDIVQNYDALIQYNSLFHSGELQFPSLPMSPEGQIHFEEVRDIFVFVQIALLVSGLLLLIGVPYKLRKKEPGFLLAGAVMTVGIPLILAALIALDWQNFFVAFHKMFFNNDYWIFDAARDPVILMLPDAFFMHCALMILGLAAVLSALCFVLWRVLRAGGKKRVRILFGANSAIQAGEVLEILRKSLSIIDRRLTEHNDRVAYILFRMLEHGGKQGDYDLEKLFVLGAFHDIGARKIDEIDEMVKVETPNVMRHSVYGYLFLKELSPLGDYAETILYHHMAYDQLMKIDSAYKDYAQLICLADRVDISWQHGGGKVDYEALRKEKGREFDPDFVELFIEADQALGIVEKCVSGDYRKEIDKIAQGLQYTKEELLGYLRMIVFIIDFVSAQTSVHTANTVQVSEEIARRVGFSGRVLDIITYGALLHDIGKIAIPTSILESPVKLTPEQWEIMKSHVSITDEILMSVVTDEIRNIAARHHEKLDGSGYPKGLTAQELSLPERIVAVADIMSALIGVRSYKNSFPKEEVVSILTDMRDKGLLDKELCDLVIRDYDEIVAAVVEGQGAIVKIYDHIATEYEKILERFMVT